MADARKQVEVCSRSVVALLARLAALWLMGVSLFLIVACVVARSVAAVASFSAVMTCFARNDTAGFRLMFKAESV